MPMAQPPPSWNSRLQQARDARRQYEEVLSSVDRELGPRVPASALESAARRVELSRQVSETSKKMIQASVAWVENPAGCSISSSSSASSSASATRTTPSFPYFYQRPTGNSTPEISQAIHRSLGTTAAATAPQSSVPAYLSHCLQAQQELEEKVRRNKLQVQQQQQQQQQQQRPLTTVVSPKRDAPYQRALLYQAAQAKYQRSAVPPAPSLDTSVSTIESVPESEPDRAEAVLADTRTAAALATGMGQPVPPPPPGPRVPPPREGSPVFINTADITLRQEKETDVQRWKELQRETSKAEADGKPFARRLRGLLELREGYLEDEERMQACELGLLMEKRVFREKLERIGRYAAGRSKDMREGHRFLLNDKNEGILLEAILSVIRSG